MKSARAVVLSDYGKGVLEAESIAKLIDAARKAGLPVIVDPKKARADVFAGATLLTPNTDEMARFSGIRADSDEAAEAACRRVLETCGIEAILLTRGEAGMTLVAARRQRSPACARRDAPGLRRHRRRRHGHRHAFRGAFGRRGASRCGAARQRRRRQSPSPSPARPSSMPAKFARRSGSITMAAWSCAMTRRRASRRGRSRASRSASPMAASTFSIAAIFIPSSRRAGVSTGWLSESIPTLRRAA